MRMSLLLKKASRIAVAALIVLSISELAFFLAVRNAAHL